MKDLKHILIFTKEYRHDKISASGGTGVFYKNLAEKLAEKGYKITVFGSHKNAVNFSENGIDFYFVKDYFKKNKLREFARSVSGKINFLKNNYQKFYIDEKRYLVDELKNYISKNGKPDIIETHDWEGISLFLDELNIPFVIRYHGSWSVLEKYFGYKKVNQGKVFSEKLALPKSQNNIVISEYSKKINSELFQVKNPKLIYNGIDTGFFKNTGDEKIKNSIFYLGEVKEDKGANIAVETFNILKQKISDCTLHFVGSAGKNEETLKNLVDEAFRKDVVFHGRKNADEIRNLLSKADVMLFPSKGENFSLSLLEAMSLEKAVICNAIPSFIEIIRDGENGMIGSDVKEFADKSLEILTSPNLKNVLEQNARKTVLENFRIDKMVETTLDYYQEIYGKS